MLAGGSSGGMGVYFWIDYLRGMMDDPTKLSGVIDSGIFMDPLSLGKFALQASQLLPFFAPGALQAPSSGAGGSINVENTETINLN